MKTNRFRTLPALTFAAIFSILALSAGWAALNKGAKAPDFKLKSINGKTMTLSQIRMDPAKKGASRVVVLDFWATTCPPCIEELPNYQKLHKKYGSKGVAMVGVAIDQGGLDDVKPFVAEHKLTYINLVDPDRDAAGPYGVRYTPTTYIVDKKGVIRFVHIGYVPGIEQTIENEVKSLLK